MAGTMTGAFLFGVLLAAASTAWSADAAPKATGFTAEAIVLPPRTVGKTVVRSSSQLAVDIRVRVQNYRPGGFEPLLVIDGKPQTLNSGVRGVEGKQTILAFVVESPTLLHDGANLALQLKEDAKSRTPIPGRLSLKAIRPLDAKTTDQEKVPALEQWLRGTTPPNK